MNSPKRFLIVAAVLLAIGGIALVASRSGTQKPSPSSTMPLTSATGVPTRNCLPVGKRVKTPSFYPSDLPLPKGSFAVEVPPAQGSTHRVVFNIQGDLRTFVRFVIAEWPKKGWALGRGEAEPGEAEDQFSHTATGRFGAFKAQSTLCDTSKTWVLFVLGRRAAPTPS
ncbi:MAG: hypothetical protein ABR548_09465 [Actinomycetota bacterium]|nr:hypothetical protein [Actinomycetota bacterium]